MSDKTPQSSLPATIGKWVGLQIAGKAVGFALGTPLVTGLVMGILAYLNGLPLAWGFFCVVLVAASTAVALNQGRAFLLAYNITGKLHFVGLSIAAANNSNTGQDGYVLSVLPRNDSDISLEYEVTRVIADVEKRVGEPNPLGAILLQARSERFTTVAHIPMDLLPDALVKGRLEIEYRYGKPGRLNQSGKQKWHVVAYTNAGGLVQEYHSSFI